VRTRPHIMLRSIVGAAFGFVITLTLVDPCAGQQNVTAPSGAAIGGNVHGSTIIINNNNGPSHSSDKPDKPLALDISGRWRDSLGTVYQIDQQGTQFSFTAEGNWVSPPIGSLCRGPFRSQGGGTIRGNIATSDYQTTAGSRGNCSTKIANSIMNCVDTICGSFSVSMSRQQ
jgi:hypothetical protein